MQPLLSAAPGLALTAPWGIFEVLLLVTFAAHLLVMNVALGGTLVAFFSPGAGRGAAVDMGLRLPTVVAITVNLGIPPLLFASVLYGRYLYTAGVLSAAIWLSFFLVVMIAYALLYRAQPRLAAAGSAPILALAGVLLLAASFILVNVSTLAVRPQAWQAYFEHPQGLLVNLGDPTFFPRWLHFVTASLAVGGLFLACINRRGEQAPTVARRRLGLAWFTRGTMVQFVVGLWFLLALPGPVRHRFLGGNGLYTLSLLLGIVLAIFALLAGLRGAIGRAVGAVAATVLVMVVVRELARQAYLAPDFSPAMLPVLAQYGPFLMFLASVVASAVGIAWSVAAYRRAGRG